MNCAICVVETDGKYGPIPVCSDCYQSGRLREWLDKRGLGEGTPYDKLATWEQRVPGREGERKMDVVVKQTRKISGMTLEGLDLLRRQGYEVLAVDGRETCGFCRRCQKPMFSDEENRNGMHQACYDQCRNEEENSNPLWVVQCPTCRNTDLARLEMVPGESRILGVHENGEAEFAGGTDLDWDGQVPASNPPEYLCRHCGRNITQAELCDPKNRVCLFTEKE